MPRKIIDTKILLIGERKYDMYSKAFYEAWKELGYENVLYFATDDLYGEKRLKTRISAMRRRIECNIAFGSDIIKLNTRLMQVADSFHPQLVFVYNSRYIFKHTLRKLKKKGAYIFVYSNDNPFGNHYPFYFWRHFIKGLSVADVGFVYRTSNIEDFKNAGCKDVRQLKSYYIKERNYYIQNPTIKVPKVVFLGHYENDGRGDYIKELLNNKIETGIIKRGWEWFEEDNPYLVKLEDTHSLYNEMINSAEIAIVFLSKINNDTYTRRCFEIPAAKTLMIAPYTEDMAFMFEENKEVLFFRNIEEFVNKINYYLKHPEEGKVIAEAGYRRLIQDGHEVGNRVQFVMDVYEQISCADNVEEE